MGLVDPAFEVGAGVDARRRVSLEIDDVGVGALVPAEEMVEADLVESRRRGVGRDVSTDALFRLVGAHDHGGGVPPDQALDAPLEIGTPRHQLLFVGGNRIDVGGVGGEGQLDAVLGGVEGQFTEQPRDFERTAALQHIIKGVEPLARLNGIELGGLFWGNVSHSNHQL